MKTNRCAGIALGLAIALSAPAALASEFTTVYQFDCATGCWPIAPLLVDASDALQGLTRLGGSHGVGVLYRFDQGRYVVRHEFQETPPSAGLAEIDGVSYGLQGPTAAAPHGSLWSQGSEFKSIALPEEAGNGGSELTADGAGGMVFLAASDEPRPHGLLFGITTSGDLTLLHEFKEVAGGLVVRGGRVFGTTSAGPWVVDLRTHAFTRDRRATGNTFPSLGFAGGALFGAVGDSAGGHFYRDDRDGNRQAFGPPTSGVTGPLALARDGGLYLTANVFGNCGADNVGTGTLQRIDPVALTVEIVHTFCYYGADGHSPADGVPIGGLYPSADGSHAFGGAYVSGQSRSTLYRFTP